MWINGRAVGTVVLQGMSDSWAYGDFQPGPGFAEFAPLFGAWSLLIHADDSRSALSHAASQELRRVEFEIDRLQAELLWEHQGRRSRCSQLNIDGNLIEWKRD